MMLDRIHQQEVQNKTRCIGMDEIEVDEKLGSGAFSTVYKVSWFPNNNSKLNGGPTPSLLDDESEHDDEEVQRALFEKSLTSTDMTVASSEEDSSSVDEMEEQFGGLQDSNVYAMKQLSRTTLDSGTKKRNEAARDLVLEAKILGKLPRHANICTLYGVSDGFWANPSQGFLLLQYLPETLQGRLDAWRTHAKRTPCKQERMQQIAIPICRALSFLHANDVCYRDVKPENIGFDHHGRLQIFDFGFARQLAHAKAQFRNRVGTPRYMAPEVMRKEPYSKPADVYSFAILLWEIVMIIKPFDRVTSFDQLVDMVAFCDERPSLWSIRGNHKELKKLMGLAWHKLPSQRPSMEQCLRELEQTYGSKSSSKRCRPLGIKASASAASASLRASFSKRLEI